MPRTIINHRDRTFRFNVYNTYNNRPASRARPEMEELMYQLPYDLVPEGSIIDVTITDEAPVWAVWRIVVTAPDAKSSVEFHSQDGVCMYVADAYGMPLHDPGQNRQLCRPASPDHPYTTKEVCRYLAIGIDYDVEPYPMTI